MALPDPASRSRLAAMGIELWRSRSASVECSGLPGESDAEPRIRLASGDGDWLLVQRRPWDGRHSVLLADIQAAIGPARCRFGQWADSREAGLGFSELPARGVLRVLAFGPVPREFAAEHLIIAPTIDELSGSGEARRVLWLALLLHLGH